MILALFAVTGGLTGGLFTFLLHLQFGGETPLAHFRSARCRGSQILVNDMFAQSIKQRYQAARLCQRGHWQSTCCPVKSFEKIWPWIFSTSVRVPGTIFSSPSPFLVTSQFLLSGQVFPVFSSMLKLSLLPLFVLPIIPAESGTVRDNSTLLD